MSYPWALLRDPPPPDYPEYERLVSAARSAAAFPVDPAEPIVSAEAVWRRGEDWCTAVLGQPYPGPRHLTVVQDHLLRLADAAGVDPPLPDWIAAAREAATKLRASHTDKRAALAARQAEAWNSVLEMATVRLEIREGSRARARIGVSEYLRHAVPTTDVYSGTGPVRTHKAGRPLCEAPRRSKPLTLGGPSDAPATCVRCLQWAPQVRADRRSPRPEPGTAPGPTASPTCAGRGATR
jgi:hypothetical protein